MPSAIRHPPSAASALLYSTAVTVLAPLVLLLERRHGPAAPGRWRERLGRTRVRAEHSIWIHAVSMGEVQAAAPLVRALLERFPERAIVMTTTTATGAQRVHELFGARVQHAYLPLDLPFAVRGFLNAVKPALAIVLETELWPNLFRRCAQLEVPVLLASARLSERSVRRYRALERLLPGLVRGTLAAAHVLVQSPRDRERFNAIGARPERVEVAGNLKFDFVVPPTVLMAGSALRAALGPTRAVWVAGSTHAGEEAILLDAHAKLRAQSSNALLVMAPRHPQRFDAAAAELSRRGIKYVRRSHGQMPSAEDGVLLADTMGELQTFYAAGDVAFVGGTLTALGGHNLLEPAALGRPVLCGPHTFNAPELAAQLSAAGALRVVHDADELTAHLGALLGNPELRLQWGHRGQEVIETSRGACERLVELAALHLARPGKGSQSESG